ncbi:aminomethyl-transferring glycine dehydrogenase [Nocardioides perillae]|uniref:Glycine dehydrogenase (decarboxylating) n=1 Tax=Nocardioides perillae TaxID=1119534 RepID=A0A7Y9RXX2_9ACTN|nr:aminomethyl-transferring glycine dehydrogenase [Nocardioides perillae]NYG55955.1 glycine dehydrogenase [Nocardioides perillae]
MAVPPPTDPTSPATAARPGFADLDQAVPFLRRHVGLDDAAVATMLARVGHTSLEGLMAAAVPDTIRALDPLDLPGAVSEETVARELRGLAAMNRPAEAMIGLGYHGTITPPVIRRGVLEDPSWYTAYTPYQPEISQGRLEALLNFQTVVGDLTGLPTANASLLDEGTAAAEAMTLVRRALPRSRTGGAAGPFVVDADALPQTIAVVQTRAAAMGIEVVVADLTDGLPDTPELAQVSGTLVQYPGASGRVLDPRTVIEQTHERGGLAVVAADLLALVLLEAPGALGADVVVGSSQRFGVPLFYGGPHAGFMSVAAGLERHLPGRLVGVSVDAEGRPAYRLALQTREQHIRRDKATSNICTAQVLLAVVAAMYAVHHGPDGLRAIAQRTHRYAAVIARALTAAGMPPLHHAFFDTLTVPVPGRAAEVVAQARAVGVHLRLVDEDHVGLSTNERTSRSTVTAVLKAFGVTGVDLDQAAAAAADGLPAALRRRSDFLTHEVFRTHRSETQMLRYLRRLAGRDYALDRGMIPLGSCTMKLNATVEMEPVSLPGFADLHPFAPAEDAAGYRQLIADLEGWLAEVTGYDRVSIQPNAGSQGELAGLLAIRGYHHGRGDTQRDVCLIPSSAHGTNAASAVMAGMRVVVVQAGADGGVDMDDLVAKCEQHAERLAAIMVTYPSTHGAYEDTITDLCKVVHDHGGQVYVDGANLNALVGHARPGAFGGDVSHLNLHKTFCIPHGGGGPGVGPVAVRAHLAPYLPSHPMHPEADKREGIGPISAAPYGSAGILPISWAYVRLMGGAGLTHATSAAVLAANYVAARLEEHFPVLYRGHGGLVAHECILDLRPLAKETGVSVDDVAKRLVDYGFHAPTMSFPVAGTLMVEPTESEDLPEIDRFCDAMVAIKREADRVGAGEWSAEESPLRHAPHTARALVGEWDRAYPRELGAFPTGVDPDKYWPPVARIDQAYGDRNLVCSCPDPSAFAEPDSGTVEEGATA